MPSLWYPSEAAAAWDVRTLHPTSFFHHPSSNCYYLSTLFAHSGFKWSEVKTFGEMCVLSLVYSYVAECRFCAVLYLMCYLCVFVIYFYLLFTSICYLLLFVIYFYLLFTSICYLLLFVIYFYLIFTSICYLRLFVLYV